MTSKATKDNLKIKTLKKIKYAIKKQARGISPRDDNIFFGGIAGAIIWYLITLMNFFAYGNPVIFVAFVACVTVGVLIGLRISKYKEWDEYIYDHLNQYQPVDQEYYAHLQTLARENRLRYADIMEFADSEMQRIAPRALTVSEIARQKFINKS